MTDRDKYIKTAKGWLGAKRGDGRYEKMLAWFNRNKQGYKADSENCAEFGVACAIQAFGVDQTYIPVCNYSNGQAKMWPIHKTPRVGSIAYFDYKDGNGISHEEIVTGLTEKEIITINGNHNHQVVEVNRKRTYRYFAGFAWPDWKEERVDMNSWQKAATETIVLKKGSVGPMVVWLGNYLQRQGYYLNGKGNDFGPYMQQEVLRWQKANGLYPDAEIASNCWRFILRED